MKASSAISAYLRTFTMQGSWNYDRMVGTGVAFASEPILRELPGGAEGAPYREALGRASQYFNGHPYLTPLAVGALARAEFDGVDRDQATRLRKALTGPLGSMGDKLIWAGALPVSSAIGLGLAVTVSPIVAIVAALLVYNLVHLTVRTWALAAGWRGSVHVAQQLGAPLLQRGLKIAGPAAGLAVGLALPLVAAWLVKDFDIRGLVGVGLIAASGLFIVNWVLPTLDAVRFALSVLVLALIAGWL
ncbi:MAG: PTS system mannose/fructose/sorbose family transporter subunit IID [Gemmatimonadales bacterium]